jgi:hypothetical protein
MHAVTLLVFLTSSQLKEMLQSAIESSRWFEELQQHYCLQHLLDSSSRFDPATAAAAADDIPAEVIVSLLLWHVQLLEAVGAWHGWRLACCNVQAAQAEQQVVHVSDAVGIYVYAAVCVRVGHHIHAWCAYCVYA